MKEFVRHLKQFSIILVVCYAIVVALNFEYAKQFNGFGFVKQFINVFTYTFAIYIANTLVLSDYYLKREKNFSNIIVGGILVNLLTVIVVLILEFFGYYIFIKSSVSEAFSFLMKNSVVMLWFSMTISTIVYIVALVRRKDKIEIKEQKAIAVTATTSFETLKNQLDPHFLFNSLNVLTALIEENPTKAQEFTVSLSKIYRYVLDQKDKDLISVDEELGFSKLYVSLLKMRFENAIMVNFPQDDSLKEVKIVPLSLQLLLENAVKHNIVSDSKPLQIDIFKEDDYLVVQNTYQKKQTLDKSSGIGLKNIMQRYQLVSDKVVEIHQSEHHFKVKLPLITGESLFTYKEELLEISLFDNAYKKMQQLKEFYVTVFSAITGIPLFIVVNIWVLPEYKWSIALCFFMAVALAINGIRTLNLFRKWEQKQVFKQINKK